MNNLPFKWRILVALPGGALVFLGTVVWDMKILGVIGVGYLLVVEYVLKKQKKAEKK